MESNKAYKIKEVPTGIERTYHMKTPTLPSAITTATTATKNDRKPPSVIVSSHLLRAL